jgi:hypothetical protein
MNFGTKHVFAVHFRFLPPPTGPTVCSFIISAGQSWWISAHRTESPVFSCAMKSRRLGPGLSLITAGVRMPPCADHNRRLAVFSLQRTAKTAVDIPQRPMKTFGVAGWEPAWSG